MENFRINRENKTFVFDDGEEIPIPKDKQKEVLRTPHARKLQGKSKEIAKTIHEATAHTPSIGAFGTAASESNLANPGQTLYEYLESGIQAFSPGEGQEELGFIDKVLDNFYAKQAGRKEFQAELAQQHPIATRLGQAAGTLGELALLGGLPAAAALPIMGAAHSDTSILEPTEKIPELAGEALTGLLVDRFFNGLNKVAGHRQTRRGIQDAIKSTESANAAEIERAARATAADEARFATETAAREAEINRLPALQEAENQAFLNAGSKEIERVAQTIGKSPISAEVMAVEPFIADVIETSVYAGSKEGNRVSKFLRSIFKGNSEGKLTGEAIQKGLKSVDELMLKEGGATAEILREFRNFVTQEMPSNVGTYISYEKWAPKIQNRLFSSIEADLTKSFKPSNEVFRDVQSQMGRNFIQDLNNSMKADIEAVFAQNAGNFESALTDGTIANEIKNVVESNKVYQELVDNLLEFQTFVSPAKSKFGRFQYELPVPKGFQDVKNSVMELPNQIADRMISLGERYLPDIRLEIVTKSGVAQNSLGRLPISPNIVPQPPAVSPAQIVQPNLTQVPQMPAPQGVLQKLAYGLESLGESGIGGMARGIKDNATTGLLAKMAGVPLGKIAAGGAAVATGLSALTSPSVMGGIARTSLEQTARMMSAVSQRAEQYPSYAGNGILNDPMERRSLVKEIEDDINMKLEDKALIQSKVNRGQPLIPGRSSF